MSAFRNLYRNPQSFAIWSAIILLALTLRSLPIASCLPYSNYVDEGHVFHPTIGFFKRHTIDTGWYAYPSLPAYLTAAGILAYEPFYRLFHGHSFLQDLPTGQNANYTGNYDFISPPELIIAGRAMAVILSLGTVILSGLIARRIANTRSAFFALLLTAVCPALVTRAPNLIIDTFATFFALLAVYLSLRIEPNAGGSMARNSAGAGFAVGLAFSSKYPAVLAGVVVIVSILFIGRRKFLWFLLLTFAAVGLVLGIALGAPSTFLHPARVAHDILATAREYNNINMNSARGYFSQSISFLELGWPLMLASCAGILLMLRDRRTRGTMVGWILFGIPFAAIFAVKSFQPFRNLLPVVPLLCIAAAFALALLTRWTFGANGGWLRYAIAFIAVGGTVIPLFISSTKCVAQRMKLSDTRVQAVNWLQRHSGKNQRVLALAELQILPSEWRRLQAQVSVVSWFEAGELLERDRFDYLVSAEFDLSAAPDPSWSTYRDIWNKKISAIPLQAEFGVVPTPAVPFFWRTNHQRITIRAAQKE